jgi:TetR/AcrR family transcriptional regulator
MVNNPIKPIEHDREKRILQAARREFIEKGLAGARMLAIAERAGVNKALLHYYYRSKEGLYKAALAEVLENVWKTLRDELATQPANDDMRTLVRLVVATYINTISGNIDFARLFIREVADGGVILPELISQFVSAFGEIPRRILDVIARNRNAGTIRPVDPVHLIMNVMGMCVVTFIAQFIFESNTAAIKLPLQFDRPFFDTRISEITAMVMDGISPKGERT